MTTRRITRTFATVLLAGALIASSIPVVANADGGDVDGRDFLVWQRGDAPAATIGAGDLADWQSNYGAGSASAASDSDSEWKYVPIRR